MKNEFSKCYMNYFSPKIKKYQFFYLIAIILVMVCNPISAQNLALNKSYTLSALPNYPYSAPSTDKTSLTDGIYTSGHFWSKPTTVGWLRRQVTITIDLGSIQPIGKVTFNSARKTVVGVDYPKNIYIFISDDDKTYGFVGDAADTPDNLPGDYQVKKIILNNINCNARYVALIVVQNGKMSFCDEIEVIKGSVGTKNEASSILKTGLEAAADSLQALDYGRLSLIQEVKKLQETPENNIIKTNNDFTSINNKLDNKNISENSLKEIKTAIGKTHASALSIKFPVPFVLEKFNPWDTSLVEFRTPKENLSSLDYKFSVLKNGVEYGAFVLTNVNKTPQQFTFKVFNPDANKTSIDLFNVPYVPSINFRRVPDPLVAVDSAITIDPGVSQMLFFKISGLKKGITTAMISIFSGDIHIIANISIKVFDIPSYDGTNNLNANVWAYLNDPMIKDRQEQAATDLAIHHINSLVVPPAFIPIPGNSDFSKLISYLSHFKSTENIFLFTNYASSGYRNVNKKIEYLSPDWKTDFTDWYNKMLAAIKSTGISSNIYLYPYDEVGGKDIRDYKILVSWAKASIMGIKFFATLTRKEAIDTILPLIDIAQISNYPDVLNVLPSHTCEIWSYTGGSPSRSLSPYNFYRLMAWKAFFNDVTGIGFWAYADEGHNKIFNLISDPLTNPLSSYSVIYDGPGKEIISTRRWEAFRMGIEDYSIFTIYSRKYGLEKTKTLINQVLENLQDPDIADEIRNQMLDTL